MLYTDKTAVQNYVLTNIDASFNAQVTEWITAMSRFMDRYTGRTLVEDTADTRVFDGNGERELVIDEVCDITAVTVGGTTITPYEYPANSAAKYRLELDTDVFTRGKQNVAVTGHFGHYTALPDDIKFACTVLVAGIVQNSNNQDAGVKSEKVGQYSVTYHDEGQRADFKRAMTILDLHKRLSF